MSDLEFHEAANLFPLNEEELGVLAKDIRANGQHKPIELFDGKIIDGRRRYKACQIAGTKPTFMNVIIDDPIAYALSLNLHRRQLTPSQCAMIGQKAMQMYTKQAKERQKLSKGRGEKGPVNLPDLKGDARDLAGKAVGVSGKLIDHANTVVNKGVPELEKAVNEGRLSVSSAAKIATTETEDTQKELADKAKFSGGRYRQPKVHEPKEEDDEAETQEPIQSRGKGVAIAHEAINVLNTIPKSDGLRKDGFQLVLRHVQRVLRSM